MTEAERLVKAGVKELLVISQDTSAYGLDIKYAESPWKGAPLKARFFDLAQALGELGAWVRLHYVYPYPHVDDVLPLMAEGKILPYLDIPFQHASPAVLKAMRRPAHQEKTLERIESLARDVSRISPSARPSSSAFPARPSAISSCCSISSREAKLARVGCFKYEPVEGAAANDLAGRRARGGEGGALAPLHGRAAGGLRRRSWQARVGRTIDVLIDEVDDEGAIGRSHWDAPEIDGSVFLNGATGLKPGDIVKARVAHADDYDLWAEVV